MGKFYINKTLPQWVSRFLGTFLTKKYLKFTDQTTYEVLSSLTKNEDIDQGLDRPIWGLWIAPAPK